MPQRSKSFKLRYLIHTCLATSLSLPMFASAQSEPEVEEVCRHRLLYPQQQVRPELPC